MQLRRPGKYRAAHVKTARAHCCPSRCRKSLIFLPGAHSQQSRNQRLVARARQPIGSDDEGDDDADWAGEDDLDSEPVLDLSGYREEDDDEEGAPSDDDDVNPEDWLDLVDGGNENAASGDDDFEDDDDDDDDDDDVDVDVDVDDAAYIDDDAEDMPADLGSDGGADEDDVSPEIMAAMGFVKRPRRGGAGAAGDEAKAAPLGDDDDDGGDAWDADIEGLAQLQVDEEEAEAEAEADDPPGTAASSDAERFEERKAEARARIDAGAPPRAAATAAASSNSGVGDPDAAAAPVARAPVGDNFDIDSLIAAGKDEDAGKIDQILERIGLQDTAGPARVEALPQGPSREYPPLPERSIKFGELLTKCGYEQEVLDQYSDALDVEITGVSNFADQVEAGHLFACESGPFYDGHEHIAEAVERGAALVVARLLLPGAEMAMCIREDDETFDPRLPQFEGLYNGDCYYGLADNDTKVLGAAREQIVASYEHLETFAAANGIDARTKERMQTAAAARIASGALEYDISHWDDMTKGLGPDDHKPTPHPFNHMVPVEMDVPVVFAIDPRDFCAALAAAFYDHPSTRMKTVTITGDAGKTTVAWILRSILEQHNLVTGLVSSVEDAIAADRLTVRGALWEAAEPDSTLTRESTAPFCAAPYQGKYEKPCTTPDPVAMQQLLAGMADRGAQAVCIEASLLGTARGGMEWVRPDVAVMTTFEGGSFSQYDELTDPIAEYSRVFAAVTDPRTQRIVVNMDDPLAHEMWDAAFRGGEDEIRAMDEEREAALQAVLGSFHDSDDDDAHERDDYDDDINDENDDETAYNDDDDDADDATGRGRGAAEAAVAAAPPPAPDVAAAEGAPRRQRPPAFSEVPLSWVVTYSMHDPYTDVHLLQARYSIWETELLVQTPRGSMELATPLVGEFNAVHTLACIAAAVALEVPLQTIVDALGNAELVPGRCEMIDEGQKFQVLIDAADTPARLRTVLRALRACTDCKRIILVFGCDGDGPAEERPVMGALADELADVVILTNDNPGAALPQDIIADITRGFSAAVRNAFPGEAVPFLQDVGRVEPLFEDDLLQSQGEVRRHVIEDRFCAVRAAISIGQPNDVVLIAGKGAQDYQTNQNMSGEVFRGWFDDRVEARNALSKLPALESIPYLVRKNLPWTSKQH